MLVVPGHRAMSRARVLRTQGAMDGLVEVRDFSLLYSSNGDREKSSDVSWMRISSDRL